MKLNRSSGLLLHITSLPSAYGTGDLGPSAYDFVDFLRNSGHKYWQLLPLNPTDADFSYSPYSSFSAFAGNPLLISPELLERDGFIDLKDFPPPTIKNPEKADFSTAEKYKTDLFDAALKRFKEKELFQKEYDSFVKEQASWLEDYTLYVALKKYYQQHWVNWPVEYKDRSENALQSAREKFAEVIEKEKFIQFLFYFQWKKLVVYAHKNQVEFIGDIPFYVNHDSADCWANQRYFKLDKDKNPVSVSGVPPDYFSKTGQLWGTPVFDWKALKADEFKWWVERIEQNLLLFDVVRLDHFRAFSAFWEVPAHEKTAINGKWTRTPGTDFFRRIKKEFPGMPFIAEDLGLMDKNVYRLIDRFDFPGMKVLHFAFGEDMPQNAYVPHNHTPHSIIYTGTHDNNTTKGWFKNAGKTEKENLQEYAGKPVNAKNVHQIMHRMALASVCNLAVVPVQDILGSGEEAIMNTPGTTENNWTWRLKEKELPTDKISELKELNILFGRVVETEQAEKE